MVQIAVPISDTSFTWSPTPVCPATGWCKIDETVASADDCTTMIAGGCSCVVNQDFDITNITDPETACGHIVRARARNPCAGCGNVGVIVELREGATVRATLDTPNLTSAFVTHTYTLTACEANNITDYTNLNLRLRHDASVECAVAEVTAIEFETPNAPAAAVTIKPLFINQSAMI